MKRYPPLRILRRRSDSIGSRAVVLALLFAWTGCAEMGAGRGGQGRAPEAEAPAGRVALANPASVNCVEQGGTLTIRRRGDGGEYGICVFAGGRQCEEWALMRGECPAGGVPVADLPTPEARYCAVTGGRYRASRSDGMQGTGGRCAFPDGRSCDARGYYEGRCPRYP